MLEWLGTTPVWVQHLVFLFVGGLIGGYVTTYVIKADLLEQKAKLLEERLGLYEDAKMERKR